MFTPFEANSLILLPAVGCLILLTVQRIMFWHSQQTIFVRDTASRRYGWSWQVHQ